MGDSSRVHQELKRVLREARVTYAAAAAHLGLSEATVKRLFSKEAFSLKRLEAVCELAGIELAELVERVAARREFITALTREQEEALVADPKMLLVTYMIINGQSVEHICATHKVSASEAQRFLVRLDRLKIIELLPFNRIRRLTARNFSWHRDGPVQRFFAQRIQSEFFDSDFGAEEEDLKFVAGAMTGASIGKFKRALDRAAAEFDEVVRQDAAAQPEERRTCGAVLAIRPWEPAVFSRLRRSRF